MPDLTTLAALKARLKIAATDGNADDDLAELITQTSADFHRAINRSSLYTAEYDERRDGQGGHTLILRNGPVQSVTRLIIDGTTISSSPDGVQPGYVFDDDKIALIGFHFSRGYSNVQVQYSAGFGADLASLPADIELAVRDWCEYRYRMRAASGMASKRFTTGETVTYDHQEMPLTTARVIEQYKRRAPAL